MFGRDEGKEVHISPLSLMCFVVWSCTCMCTCVCDWVKWGKIEGKIAQAKKSLSELVCLQVCVVCVLCMHVDVCGVCVLCVTSVYM